MATISLAPYDAKLYRQIRDHLADLHTRWQNDPDGGTHHKNDEGDIRITFSAGTWFDNDSNAELYQSAPAVVVSIEIFSYLFCPQGRIRTYTCMIEAWEDVKSWTYPREDGQK